MSTRVNPIGTLSTWRSSFHVSCGKFIMYAPLKCVVEEYPSIVFRKVGMIIQIRLIPMMIAAMMVHIPIGNVGFVKRSFAK